MCIAAYRGTVGVHFLYSKVCIVAMFCSKVLLLAHIFICIVLCVCKTKENLK